MEGIRSRREPTASLPDSPHGHDSNKTLVVHLVIDALPGSAIEISLAQSSSLTDLVPVRSIVGVKTIACAEG